MAQQPQQKLKGGRKLRRHVKDKSYYAGGFSRTGRNKLKAKERILRRQLENPSPGRAECRRRRKARFLASLAASTVEVAK